MTFVGQWSGSSSSARASLRLGADGRFTLSVETPAGYMVEDEEYYEGRWRAVGDDELTFDLESGSLRSGSGAFGSTREEVPAQAGWRTGRLFADGTLDVDAGARLTKE